MVLFSSVFFRRHDFSFLLLWSHPYGQVTVLCQVHRPGSHQLHSHLHVVLPDPHLPPRRLQHQKLFHAAPLDCLDSYRLISERNKKRILLRDRTLDIEVTPYW